MTAVVSPGRLVGVQTRPERWAHWAGYVPLAVTLAAQVVLTARLIPTAIASHDEAGYIYAGHELIHELWHGGGSPYYETYFSGAPVLYPVLAALVDHVGGLTAVRLASTLFMGTATVLAFATARRLFGYFAAVVSAALFAGLGLTQDLGAYATYDSLAIMLVATAAYCAVRSADSSFWLIMLPVTILVANAVKYATLLFDPIVIALAATQASSWKQAARRIAALCATTVPLLGIIAVLAGGAYIKGILFSTLSRQAGHQTLIGASSQPATVIVTETWHWIGAVLVLGAVALIIAICAQRDRKRALVVTVLVVAGMLVTFEALRLHSDESMRKHDDYGAWFTCITAGYAVDWVVWQARHKYLRISAAILALAGVTALGAHYSALAPVTYEAGRNSEVSWPPSRLLPFFALMRPYLSHPGGRYLVGGVVEDQLLYTDHITLPWYNYVNDVYIKYPVPGGGGDASGQVPGQACATLTPGCRYLEGTAGFQAAIRAHWFTLVSMVGNHGVSRDREIAAAVARTPGYVLLTRVGGAPTWIYAPAYHASTLRTGER